MDSEADDRLRSAVLAGVALAALAVGGWWWRAAAPAPTAGPATAAPTAGPTVSTALDRVLASGVPGEGVTALVDPETGEATEVRRAPGVSIDPETGWITDIDGDSGEFFFQGDASGGLPRFSETIWRERATLTPGQPVTRQSADDGARYLLQYRCTGPGAMLLVITGAQIAGSPRVDCDGTVSVSEVDATGGLIRVSLSTAGEQPVEVEAQLAALP
ncbi:hypothetical protein [Micromonospora sp. NPDC000668]|uniref:hypothetical protein n=1 Tax=Micromonospora sp. NPDC000668 TaxID=3364219 RepID=UPI003681FE39